MRRATVSGILLAAAFLLLVAAVGPATAHTNNAEADAQRSADGTLVVEWVFSELDGWLVVRTDDDGEPGEVIGHRRLPADPSFRTDRTVAIDDDAWSAQTGSRTVWVMLHHEESGQGFDPDDDPPVTFLESIAGSRITVEKTDRPASVTTQKFSPQSPSEGTVTIRRAALPERGFLAIRASDADIPTTATKDDLGEVVGVVALDRGVHRNVTVDLDAEFVAASNGTRIVQAVLYRGTGTFDPETANPVTAGDSTVSTGFALDFAEEAASTATEDEGHATHTEKGTHGTHGTHGTTDGDGTGVGAFGTALVLLVTAAAVFTRRRP